MFGLVSTRTTSTHRISRQLQALEDRTVPAFINQGPFQIQTLGGTGITPNNAAIGPIQAVVADPTNPDRVFVGAVSGGIWRTLNATAASPTWTALTDFLPTLSIGDLKFSPLDPNVLYAGTGNYSKLVSPGGDPFSPTDTFRQGFSKGVYRSTDGGATWAVFPGDGVFANQRIRTVLPTRIVNAGGGLNVDNQRVFAGTYDANNPTSTTNGLYESNNGGRNWFKLTGSGLPAGGNFSVSDLVSSPGDPSGRTLFAGIIGQGVYKTVDGGATWTLAATGVTAGVYASSTDIKFGVHKSGPGSVLYVGISDAAQTGAVVFRSVDQGATFASLGAVADANGGIFSGGPKQAGFNFSVEADPNNPNVVVVSGDSLFLPNVDGISVFTGRFLRYNGATWQTLTLDGAGGDAPRAGARDMTFDAQGNLLEVSDSGVYKLSLPNSILTRSWTSINGNLSVTELTSAQFDGNSGIYFGGAYGAANPEQPFVGATSYLPITTGFGQIARVDTVSIPGSSIRYRSAAAYTAFRRDTYDSNNNLISTATPTLLGFPAAAMATATQYTTNYTIDKLDPTRIVFGGLDGGIYESFDRGDSVSLILSAATQISSLAYGGIVDGVRDGDLLYAGTIAGALYRRVYPGQTPVLLAAYVGGSPQAIAIDPNDGTRVYVADRNGRIWFSADAGVTFSEITSNLPGFTTEGMTLQVADYTPGIVGDAYVMVGGRGGVYVTSSQDGFVWRQLSNPLPSGVVNDMQYIPELDKLVVSVQGRGIWSLDGVRAEILQISSVDPNAFTVVAYDTGGPGLVRVVNPDGSIRFDFQPFGIDFRGGIRVAQGDINGDGVNDIVVAAGPGGGPHVKVYDGKTGNLIRSFFAYDTTMNKGVYVAVGDVNGDGFADIVTGTGAGAAPHVKVFSGRTGAVIGSFFAYDTTMLAGVQVAVGDVNGDGFADIVTGTGPGAAPHVKVFSGKNGFSIISSFFAYDPRLLSGVSVAAGDLNGDGRREVITAPLSNAPAHIEGFDISNGNRTIVSFFGLDETQNSGARVGTIATSANSPVQIVVGPGPGGASILRRFSRAGLLVSQVSPLDEGFNGGIFVG